jgi:anthranilate phosphoribosyltransferase
MEGLDEISVCGPTRIACVRAGEVAESLIEPADLGLPTFEVREIAGGDTAENAAILRSVLEGRGSEAQRAVVGANAGAGIWVGGGAETLRAGVDRARETIASGQGAELLDRLVDLTARLAPG